MEIMSWDFDLILYIDGLVQDCSISSAVRHRYAEMRLQVVSIDGNDHLEASSLDFYINGLMQDCSISIAVEILQSGTKPSICWIEET